jgi:GTP-binding protein
LVINKGDTSAAKESAYDFYSLGIERQVLISAEHNLGLGELRDSMAELIPDVEALQGPEGPRLAIVGRPNVGKSSLLNRLLGKDRVLVSDQPGTTRDPIDTVLELDDGSLYVLVDTAGIRRRGRVSDAPEELAVMMARRQIEGSDLAVLVVDASQGVTTGDLAIAGTAWELGKPCVIVVNKWDLLDEQKRTDLEESWQRLDEILAEPPRVNISALTGRGIDKIFPAVEQTLERFELELGTSELNRLFESLVRRHRPPEIGGHSWNLLYVTQVKTSPPTFMLFANRQLPQRSTYRRYLVNGVRRELGLEGIPIRLVVRKR